MIGGCSKLWTRGCSFHLRPYKLPKTTYSYDSSWYSNPIFFNATCSISSAKMPRSQSKVVNLKETIRIKKPYFLSLHWNLDKPKVAKSANTRDKGRYSDSYFFETTGLISSITVFLLFSIFRKLFELKIFNFLANAKNT